MPHETSTALSRIPDISGDLLDHAAYRRDFARQIEHFRGVDIPEVIRTVSTGIARLSERGESIIDFSDREIAASFA